MSSPIFTHAFLYFHTSPLPRPRRPLRAPVTSAKNRSSGVLQCVSSGLRTQPVAAIAIKGIVGCRAAGGNWRHRRLHGLQQAIEGIAGCRAARAAAQLKASRAARAPAALEAIAGCGLQGLQQAIKAIAGCRAASLTVWHCSPVLAVWRVWK